MIKIPRKTCCGTLSGDQCGCLTPDTAAAEMASVLREQPPIVMPTGPAADAERARNDATNPLLIAMRAAAVDRYTITGAPR